MRGLKDKCFISANRLHYTDSLFSLKTTKNNADACLIITSLPNASITAAVKAPHFRQGTPTRCPDYQLTFPIKTTKTKRMLVYNNVPPERVHHSGCKRRHISGKEDQSNRPHYTDNTFHNQTASPISCTHPIFQIKHTRMLI